MRKLLAMRLSHSLTDCQFVLAGVHSVPCLKTKAKNITDPGAKQS